ncbi:hypothetical protein [Anaeromyxobacter paludicola]|uniref:hypothetical protein n=1 Tax=Anaeromyxobacter paludicola TaxID=2918171 RepID=UPI0020BE69E6|nr:hypothetical protein [Anaeromyxobacter paludicola]
MGGRAGVGPGPARGAARLATERREGAERGADVLRDRRSAMDLGAEAERGRGEPGRVAEPSPAPPGEDPGRLAGAPAPSAGAGPGGAMVSAAAPSSSPPAARSAGSTLAAERLVLALHRRERESPELSLSLGGALEVRLAHSPAGVEVAVRAAPSRATAARAELPSMLRALTERGVRVARAEVQPGCPGAPLPSGPAAPAGSASSTRAPATGPGGALAR